MTDIFIDPESEFKVVLFVAKTATGGVVADIDKKALTETYEGLDEALIEQYEVFFRYPSFIDNTLISNAAMTVLDGQITVNPTSMRLKRMQVLAKRWNFKDKNGKQTVPSPELIAQLHPVIANVLSLAIEQKIE